MSSLVCCSKVNKRGPLVASQCADGRLNPLQSLYSVEIQMGLGPAMKLTLVASQQVACALTGRQGPSLSVGAPPWQLLKREPRGGVEGRISPKRCVSSMLICHTLNLYCSSTGSISHIARTLVLQFRRGFLLVESVKKNRRGTRKNQQRRRLLKLKQRGVVTLDPSSSVSSVHEGIHQSTLLFGICVLKG